MVTRIHDVSVDGREIGRKKHNYRNPTATETNSGFVFLHGSTGSNTQGRQKGTKLL